MLAENGYSPYFDFANYYTQFGRRESSGSFWPSLEHVFLLECMDFWELAISGDGHGVDDSIINTPERFKTFATIAAVEAQREGYPLMFDFHFLDPRRTFDSLLVRSKILDTAIASCLDEGLILQPHMSISGNYELSKLGDILLQQGRDLVSQLTMALAKRRPLPSSLIPLTRYAADPPERYLRTVIKNRTTFFEPTN